MPANLIFVDCEAWGDVPRKGRLTEFGAVDFASRATFHGKILNCTPDPRNPAISLPSDEDMALGDVNYYIERAAPEFRKFQFWLFSEPVKRGNSTRRIMVSDNPAYDFMWIADGFHMTLGQNPFGHSARRLGDFYAGLLNNFYVGGRWKDLRVTPHDHNPVNDAMGNVEAFERMLKGER